MIERWSVHLELHIPTATDLRYEVLDDIHDDLIAHHPNVTISRSNYLSIQLSVDATTARQAVDAALKHSLQAAANHSVDASVVSVELMTEQEQQRRLASPPIPALAGISEVAEILGVSRQRASRIVRVEGFPALAAHLKSGPVFVAEQVRRYGTTRRSAGRPRGGGS